LNYPATLYDCLLNSHFGTWHINLCNLSFTALRSEVLNNTTPTHACLLLLQFRVQSFGQYWVVISKIEYIDFRLNRIRNTCYVISLHSYICFIDFIFDHFESNQHVWYSFRYKYIRKKTYSLTWYNINYNFVLLFESDDKSSRCSGNLPPPPFAFIILPSVVVLYIYWNFLENW